MTQYRIPIIGITLLLLSLSTLASVAFLNAGMLVLRDELLRADLAPKMYPHYNVLSDDHRMIYAVDYLRQAVALDGGSVTAHWGLGRAALVAGKGRVAADALRSLMKRATGSPLLYLDTLWAFSYGEQPDKVVTLYESTSLPPCNQLANDMVALAYLEIAEEQESVEVLEKALDLRPGDLYADYRLWQAAKSAGDVRSAAAYSESLVHFPFDAINPVDGRLFRYVSEAIQALWKDELWSQEKKLNLISFLVREQSENAAEIEHLLTRLIKHYPSDPDLLLYLAELYRQQGDFGQMKRVYEHILDLDSGYKQAYLRLGGESLLSGRMREAAGWYAKCNEVSPGDLACLKDLAEICTKLEQDDVWNEDCQAAAEHESENLNLGEIGSSAARTLWLAWQEYASTNRPQYYVGQHFENGWTFIGYDVDEERLIRGDPVSLVLYWESPPDVYTGELQTGWYRAGRRWIQVLDGATNLVENGGFELGTFNGLPAGFSSIYGAPRHTKFLTEDSRQGNVTTVVVLNNSRVYTRTGLASMFAVSVESSALYLQSGWIKSLGGNGFLGRVWTPGIKEHSYDYVVTRVTASDWRHYSRLARPLQGSKLMRLWLINFDSVGQVYFDNVFLVKIPAPWN